MAQICNLLQLAQSLIATLNETSVKLLYRAIKPLIRNDLHGTGVQKRSYKVLLLLCDEHNAIVCSADNQEQLTELIDLLIGSLLTCHVSGERTNERKWLQPPTSSTELTSIHSIRLARSVQLAT